MQWIVIKVARGFFAIATLLFAVGVILLWVNEEIGAGVMISAFAQFIANALLLRCKVCGKSPYIRERDPIAYSFPIPELTCSRCGAPLGLGSEITD